MTKSGWPTVIYNVGYGFLRGDVLPKKLRYIRWLGKLYYPVWIESYVWTNKLEYLVWNVSCYKYGNMSMAKAGL